MHLFLVLDSAPNSYRDTNLTGQVSMSKARYDQGLLQTVVLSHLPYSLSIVLHMCVQENLVLTTVVNARCIQRFVPDLPIDYSSSL